MAHWQQHQNFQPNTVAPCLEIANIQGFLKIKSKFAKIKSKFSKIKSKFAKIRSKFSKVKSTFAKIKNTVYYSIFSKYLLNFFFSSIQFHLFRRKKVNLSSNKCHYNLLKLSQGDCEGTVRCSSQAINL